MMSYGHCLVRPTRDRAACAPVLCLSLVHQTGHWQRKGFPVRGNLAMKSVIGRALAGEPGFEPGLTESESVGLPLTYSPTVSRALPRRDGLHILM